MKLDPARQLSKALFKANYRLEVAAAIAPRARENATFTNKELASELGDPPGRNGVSGELQVLRDAGLIKEVGAGDGRTKPHVAVPSAYWEACVEMQTSAEVLLGSSDVPLDRSTKIHKLPL